MWLALGNKGKVLVSKFTAGLVVAVRRSRGSEETLNGEQSPS